MDKESQTRVEEKGDLGRFPRKKTPELSLKGSIGIS
jgi:hypothetical protein